MESVYTGFWIDWTEGRIEGGTLTLASRPGLVLLSFMTLFVQFTGACFWQVLCFILHQSRSTTAARDGLFHQQQTILRNSTTAPSALWNLYSAALAWRGRVNSSISKSMPLFIATIVHLLFFAAAGLFASQVTATRSGASALVQSSTCGFPVEIPHILDIEQDELTKDQLEASNAQALIGKQTILKSASYVRNCYAIDADSSFSACNSYQQPRLQGKDASAEKGADCPFGNDACLTGRAVRYGSGAIHSSNDLGINRPDQESLTVERVTTCSPIDAEKYAKGWEGNLPDTTNKTGTAPSKLYEFGTVAYIRAGCLPKNVSAGIITFCVTASGKGSVDYQPYYTETHTSYFKNANVSDINLISDFNVSKADVTLIGMVNQARYADRVEDPFFYATNRAEGTDSFYVSKRDISVMGCTEQYNFCTVNTKKCTGLSGIYDIRERVSTGVLDLSPIQNATFTLLWETARWTAMQWAWVVLESQIYLAQDSILTRKSLRSTALRSDQWELEAQNFHNLSLAVWQRRVNEYASPDNFNLRPGQSSLSQIIPPTDPLMKELCGLQKVRSTSHLAFDAVGLSIIFVVGTVIILLDWFFIEHIFWWRSHARHDRLAKKNEWMSTGTLQLFRKALEARGVGPWAHDSAFSFPVLSTGNQQFTTGWSAGPETQGSLHYSRGDDQASTTYLGAGSRYNSVPSYARHESEEKVELHTLHGYKSDESTRIQKPM